MVSETPAAGELVTRLGRGTDARRDPFQVREAVGDTEDLPEGGRELCSATFPAGKHTATVPTTRRRTRSPGRTQMNLAEARVRDATSKSLGEEAHAHVPTTRRRCDKLNAKARETR